MRVVDFLPSRLCRPRRSPLCLPGRALSVTAQSGNDSLFEYTTGRWILNDALRLAGRRLVFNVDGLRRLAAQSVDRIPEDVVDLAKLAEGGYNRTFIITMRDGFQMLARIPYPVTVPKYYAVASEVATMAFLRSSGLPIPKVYGYSPTPDNAAETEYIFMEFIQGTLLGDVWPDLGNLEISLLLRQLVQLEAKIMSVPFPAGGSLYYTKDLEKAGVGSGIPLEDECFSVGPDTAVPVWYGRRSQLDVDRGPYENAEAALARGAHKEHAYLARFGQPLLPFQRLRRESYQFQKQTPSDHIENLDRYLLIAPSLVPRDPALRHFCIRHPDLQVNNIIVSRSPDDSGWQVTALIDWQHVSILPLFLFAGVPQRLHNYNDPISQSMTWPSLPENFDNLDESEQNRAKELYHQRIIHYHYVGNTMMHNKLHYAAETDPASLLLRRLFHHARAPWEGETIALKVALIEATQDWETLTGGGVPCPVAFDAEDARETMQLDEELKKRDGDLEVLENMIGFGEEGWVSADRYERAVTVSKECKEFLLAKVMSESGAAEADIIMGSWPLEDMDEEPYM
ncbi:protein kinase subdomain-containing protein PKL/CAK/Fmp29 [Mycena polygramma]|nr:protein kinase subdomain-containing protein PKL/CAK/Fmp29 [Mycena polygramma]